MVFKKDQLVSLSVSFSFYAAYVDALKVVAQRSMLPNLNSGLERCRSAFFFSHLANN